MLFPEVQHALAPCKRWKATGHRLKARACCLVAGAVPWTAMPCAYTHSLDCSAHCWYWTAVGVHAPETTIR